MPDNGYDRAVVAVAPGVVMRAGWAEGGWAPYGKIVYIQHSFRDVDGHRYQTLYAHLNRVKVKPGQKVRAGQVIGMMGGSSRHRLAKYGPHLHFAMYQDAKPTMGGGHAVLPEPMGNFRALRPGMTFISCGEAEPSRVAALEPEPFTLVGGGWLPDDTD
jgi:murein DD-endopeptidase MepM/ murein hydrolase activator NlpD